MSWNLSYYLLKLNYGIAHETLKQLEVNVRRVFQELSTSHPNDGSIDIGLLIHFLLQKQYSTTQQSSFPHCWSILVLRSFPISLSILSIFPFAFRFLTRRRKSCSLRGASWCCVPLPFRFVDFLSFILLLLLLLVCTQFPFYDTTLVCVPFIQLRLKSIIQGDNITLERRSTKIGSITCLSYILRIYIISSSSTYI
jgi:hypothetical protein